MWISILMIRCFEPTSSAFKVSKNQFFVQFPVTPISRLHQVKHSDNLTPARYTTGENLYIRMFLLLHGETTYQTYMPFNFMIFLIRIFLFRELTKTELMFIADTFRKYGEPGSCQTIFWSFQQSDCI